MLTPELPASQPQSLLAPHSSPSALPAAPQAPRPATPILPRTRGAQIPNNLTAPWNCPIVRVPCTNHPARFRKDCPATAENAQASREQAAWPFPASGGRACVEGSDYGGSRGHVGTNRLGARLGSSARPCPLAWGKAHSKSPCAVGHRHQHPGLRNLEADAAAGNKDRAHCCLQRPLDTSMATTGLPQTGRDRHLAPGDEMGSTHSPVLPAGWSSLSTSLSQRPSAPPTVGATATGSPSAQVSRCSRRMSQPCAEVAMRAGRRGEPAGSLPGATGRPEQHKVGLLLRPLCVHRKVSCWCARTRTTGARLSPAAPGSPAPVDASLAQRATRATWAQRPHRANRDATLRPGLRGRESD